MGNTVLQIYWDREMQSYSPTGTEQISFTRQKKSREIYYLDLAQNSIRMLQYCLDSLFHSIDSQGDKIQTGLE